VGKRRLEQAIQLYQSTYPGGKDDTFSVSWSPFYLDPTAPRAGIPLKQRMADRFGADRVSFIFDRLATIGAEVDIKFSFDSRTGNTRDSHRLIQLAKTKGPESENRVVSELFRRYFEQDADITSQDMLVSAAKAAGLDAGEAKEWLDNGKGGPEVDREVTEAVHKDIHGVPHFIIQGKHELNGAQDAETFLQEFIKVKEQK
jgi:predicted DsbA family dithiol-disulfide isomerase